MFPDEKREEVQGGALERTLKEVDKHTAGATSAMDPVPMPDHGSHAHSHAAHLESGGNEHTKPAGDLRPGIKARESQILRQPPMVVQRVGKGRRGQ